MTPGLIARLHLSDGTPCEGDLFLDCSGQAALLIHGHCGVDWVDLSAISLNDRALAVQVPTSAEQPIAAQTIGTAHEAGWIWDIAPPHRRAWAASFLALHG
jgi:hypothetical protein